MTERILTEFQTILYDFPSPKLLADWYIEHRPARQVKQSLRHELKSMVQNFTLLSDRPDQINSITEALLFFDGFMRFESGALVDEEIEELFINSELIQQQIAEYIKALKLVQSMPLSIETKTELLGKTMELCNNSEPVYCNASQIAALAELCERIPEAGQMLTRAAAVRPFIRSSTAFQTLTYLQAAALSIFSIIKPVTNKKAMAITLTAGILQLFCVKYPRYKITSKFISNTLQNHK